jgi:hypothetical protein
MADEKAPMQALDFIANVISSLAWPVLIGALIFALRKRIGTQFSRLVELTFPGGSLKFADTLAATKATSEEALSEHPSSRHIAAHPHAKSLPKDIFPSEAAIATSASLDPEEAVIRSFLLVDRALEKIFERLYPKEKFTDGSLFMVTLRSKNLISDSVWRWFVQLRRLRNVAEHVRPGTLSPSDALGYYNQCRQFAGFIDMLSQSNLLHEGESNSPQPGTDEKG